LSRGKTQHPTAMAHLLRCHLTLRQKIAAQAVGDLACIRAVVLFLGCRDGAQYQRMGHLTAAACGTRWSQIQPLNMATFVEAKS